jgi:hypothetical protein
MQNAATFILSITRDRCFQILILCLIIPTFLRVRNDWGVELLQPIEGCKMPSFNMASCSDPKEFNMKKIQRLHDKEYGAIAGEVDIKFGWEVKSWAAWGMQTEARPHGLARNLGSECAPFESQLWWYHSPSIIFWCHSRLNNAERM